jgi:hypothetical protein
VGDCLIVFGVAFGELVASCSSAMPGAGAVEHMQAVVAIIVLHAM